MTTGQRTHPSRSHLGPLGLVAALPSRAPANPKEMPCCPGCRMEAEGHIPGKAPLRTYIRGWGNHHAPPWWQVTTSISEQL